MRYSGHRPPGSAQRPLTSHERVAQLRRSRRHQRIAELRRLWPLLIPLAFLPLVLLGLSKITSGKLIAQAPSPPTAVLSGNVVALAPTLTATPTAAPTAAPAFSGPTTVPGSLARIPILMYHYIREVDSAADPLGYRLSVTPAAFATQLDWLAAQGYTPVRMEEALRCLKGGEGCPAKPIALTFDDGYADAYSAALPLLQERGFVATFYIVSGFVGQPGYMGPDEIKALHTAGMELGAHSVSHPDLSQMARADAQSQIAGSRDQIAAISGAPVTSFCYPAGKFGAETRALVLEAGFTNATTTIQSDDFSDPYTLPRLRINGDMQQAGFEWLVQQHS